MSVVSLEEYRKKREENPKDPKSSSSSPKQNKKETIDYSALEPVKKVSVGSFYFVPMLNISVQIVAFVELSAVSQPFILCETVDYDLIPLDVEEVKTTPFYQISVEDYLAGLT